MGLGDTVSPVYRETEHRQSAVAEAALDAPADLATLTNNLRYLCAGFPERSVHLGPQRIGTSELANICYP